MRSSISRKTVNDHQYLGRLSQSKPLSKMVGGILLGGWAAALLWYERRHTLREIRDSKLVRDGRNLVIGSTAGLVMQTLDSPVISVAFRAVQVCVSGTSVFTLSPSHAFLFFCILFHHSNVRLPAFAVIV